MKSSILTVILAAALLIFSGGYVGAIPSAQKQESSSVDQRRGDCCPKKKCGKQGRQMALMNAGLDLSPDQQEKIESLHAKARESHMSLRQQMREDRSKLRELTAGGSFDETAVRALAESIAKKKAELLVDRAKVRSQVFAVLNPDQQKKAKNLRDMMGPRHHGKGRCR